MDRLSRKGTTAILFAAPILVMLSGTVFAQNGVQNWDKTNPVEYYGALQTVPDAPMIVELSDGANDEAPCNQC